MILNATKIFGNALELDGSLALALTIIPIILLAGTMLILTYKLIILVRLSLATATPREARIKTPKEKSAKVKAPKPAAGMTVVFEPDEATAAATAIFKSAVAMPAGSLGMPMGGFSVATPTGIPAGMPAGVPAGMPGATAVPTGIPAAVAPMGATAAAMPASAAAPVVVQAAPKCLIQKVYEPGAEPVEAALPEKITVVQHITTTTTTTTATTTATRISSDDDEDEDEDLFYEDSVEGGLVRYNRSFMAKYIQSPEEMKGYYVHLKNELLSYNKVRARMSWKRESFSFGRNPFARLVYRGKTLCLFLPLDPAEFAESKFNVEDASEQTMYEDTPCMYRIRNDRRLNFAYELIEMAANKLGMEKIERPSTDYYLPYEGIVQLIDKGLAKRVVRSKAQDVSSLSTEEVEE